MSPIYGAAERALPASAAGNDSTLVGAFLPRQSRLSAWIAESSASTIASSAARVETAFAAAEIALFTTALAVECLRQRAERTITSICGLFFVVPRGRDVTPWPRACARRRPCRRP